jgi:hypothetical protein
MYYRLDDHDPIVGTAGAATAAASQMIGGLNGELTAAIASSSTKCPIHANNFQELAEFKRFSNKQKQSVINVSQNYLHDRHMIRVLLHEMLKSKTATESLTAIASTSTSTSTITNQQTTSNSAYASQPDTERGRKKRKVYKLVDSAAEKSISRLYERAINYLAQHTSECTIELSTPEQHRWLHTAYDVQTNYSNGNDSDFQQEEIALNTVAACVQTKFSSVAVSTMTAPTDATRGVDVSFELLAKPFSKLQFGEENGMVDETRQPHHQEQQEQRLQHQQHQQHQQQLQSTQNAYRGLVEHLKNPINRVAVKLLDFVFLNAHECWTVWNEILDRAIRVYRAKSLYPVKDSVYDITVVNGNACHREKTRKTYDPLIAAYNYDDDDDYGYNHSSIERDAIFPHHTHGLITKVGVLIDFVLSFRILMRHSIIACCYAIKREAVHRTHYTKKHDCQFPATSQGVYHELFLTSKLGHDLVCNLPVTTEEEAMQWLVTYQEMRDLLLQRKNIPFTDRLRQHLQLLSGGAYGGFNLSLN